jgi:hypothetical protein
MWWKHFCVLDGWQQLKEMLDFHEDQWHRDVIFVFQVLPQCELNSKDAWRLVPPGDKSCPGEVLAGGQRSKGGYWSGLVGGAARFPQDPHLEWPQEEVCRLRKLLSHCPAVACTTLSDKQGQFQLCVHLWLETASVEVKGGLCLHSNLTTIRKTVVWTAQCGCKDRMNGCM